MSEIRRKLDQLSDGASGHGTERINFSRQNSAWLKKSQSIGVRILTTLRAKSMTQAELAQLMGVTPPQINKIVKGYENLTLDTIAALEKALGIALVEIPKLEIKVDYIMPNWKTGYSIINAVKIIQMTSKLTPEFQLQEYSFANEEEF